MKISLFAVCLFLFNCSAHAQSSNCKQFKNGRFKSKVAGHTYIVERSGSIQKEYFIDMKDSLTVFLTVKWVDDCTYTLTPSEETRIKSKAPKNALMTVSISSTTANSYIQSSTTNFSDKTYTSEFFKIE